MYADPANEDASVVDTIIEIDPSPVIFSAGSTSIVIRAPSHGVVTVHCRREPIAARPRHPPALHAVSDAARFHAHHSSLHTHRLACNQLCVYVCVCVRACVPACVCVCVRACVYVCSGCDRVGSEVSRPPQAVASPRMKYREHPYPQETLQAPSALLEHDQGTLLPGFHPSPA